MRPGATKGNITLSNIAATGEVIAERRKLMVLLRRTAVGNRRAGGLLKTTLVAYGESGERAIID
jgi:hypothetical protein